MKFLFLIVPLLLLFGCKTEDEIANPCKDLLELSYEGQTYHTVEIGEQCWLKENLNAGTRIDSMQFSENNMIIEKYCYHDSEDSCNKYGGLYQWNEVMGYSFEEGVKGICPPGWHIPKDKEWKQLEGNVDSKYPVGDPEWDDFFECRGFDAGENLKSAYGWHSDNNGTDPYGFSALPSGDMWNIGQYEKITMVGSWWTSTTNQMMPYIRSISYDNPRIIRTLADPTFAYPVRCLKDD